MSVIFKSKVEWGERDVDEDNMNVEFEVRRVRGVVGEGLYFDGWERLLVIFWV